MESKLSVAQSAKNKLPSPEHVFEWPRQAMREKNWSEATQRWAVLRKAYPKHPASWFQGAIAHIEAGEFNEAEILLSHAKKEFSNHPNSLIAFAALAMRRQEWQEAEALLKQAREKHPDNLQAWIKSAQCAEECGKLEQASSLYQRACQCAPSQPGPLIQYAELAMRLGQWETAKNRWAMLRELFPNLPVGYLRAAEAARQLGQYKEARQLLLLHQYGTEILDNGSAHPAPAKQGHSSAGIARLLELIWVKALFNLRSEVHRNYLSYGWWILEPLLHMLIYYVVFGILLQRGGEGFTTFLLTGLIPWMWFMKAVSGSSNSILAGQNLMLQVGLPSVVFPLISLLQASLKQIPVFILLLGFVWLQGHPPNINWWLLLPVIIVQALITTTFACAVAAVIPFARDLAYLVPTGLTFLMFLSGIFYDYRSISPEWQGLFLLNPVAFLLKSYREILIDGIMPNIFTLICWGLGSLVTGLFLIFAYKRLRYIYPRIVME
ncbi:tetratricopeptide repeat protein [endosymbiont of Riftia pachyptila]|nr:tetratricopeptide repeat protein [endosymbiont of Riftia pachyptila]